MFKLYANKSQLTLREREPLTTGSVNVNTIRFEFSADWEGLTKTAVFRAGEESHSILLDGSGECTVPWEVLVSPHSRMFAGVYGTREKEVVLPTIWADLGVILEGAAPGGELYPPTPELWEQELAKKQDKLHGRLGQLVGFGENGSAVAQDAEELMQGPPGADGATYTPVVSAEGILSWTNDKGLPNPAPVNIKGPAGADGAPGSSGVDSADGVGVPAGGAVGQVLAKKTAADYDTQWVDAVDGEISSYIINAPVGAILAWSGTGDNIPTGWHICNGEGGTLDLRDRFILGAGQNHAVGDTGGSEEVMLTVEQMPSHTHAYTDVTVGGTYKVTTTTSSSASLVSGQSNTSNKTSQATGSSQPHPNMPPYYALLYIQKTGTTPEDYATEESVDTKIDALTQVKGIYTQSEFDALPEAEQSKGMYVISDSGGSSSEGDSGESLDVYSTEEKRIGTWINGDPLYRKVVSISLQNNKNDQVFDIGLPNIDTVINLRVIVKRITGNKWVVSNYTKSSTELLCELADNGLLSVSTEGFTDVFDQPTFAIVEYTKLSGTFEWWSPQMTANDVPEPYLVSASSVLAQGSSEIGSAYAAFDGNTTTIWHSNAVSPVWIQLFVGDNPLKIRGFRIRNRTGYANQGPKSFKFQGSNDGTNYETIKSFTGISYADNVWTVLNLNTTTEYKYYRLYDIYSSYQTNTKYVAISEIEFLKLIE